MNLVKMLGEKCQGGDNVHDAPASYKCLVNEDINIRLLCPSTFGFIQADYVRCKDDILMNTFSE